MHAMFTLRDGIPSGCTSITVEFDEQGAAFITARRDGHDVTDVTLSEEGMSAAGLLLTYLSYQVIALTRMHEAQGEHAVYEAQCRLVASLGTVGLAIGLLDETITDSIRVYR